MLKRKGGDRGRVGKARCGNPWGGKFTSHYTPIHAVLRHGSFASAQELMDRILAFLARWNGGEGHPFYRTFHGYPMQKEGA
jgi:hypothetical protein